MRVRFVLALLPLAFAFAPDATFAAAADTQKVSGDEWETTVKMSMPGMPMQMPAHTSKFCRAKNKAWDEPPMDKQTQDRCKISGYALSGNHATWKVTCDGGMSGTGDMMYQSDSYSGTMTMSMDQGSMKMEMSGKKTGADCDAMEQVRTADRMKKQAADAQQYAPGGSKDPMIAACNDGAASGNRSMFIGPAAPCKKPDQKAAFCRTAVTQKAFESYIREGNEEMTVAAEVSTYCGTTADALLKDFCAKAAAAEDLKFLGDHCPVLAKPLAEKLCAGRKFTSIADEKTRAFCTSYAAKLLGK